MSDEELNQKRELAKAASDYITGKVTGGKQQGDTGYPLNRGDIIILVMLLERELRSASSDFTDPFNRKRVTAIRDKLGTLAIDSPQMSKAEAQQCRE